MRWNSILNILVGGVAAGTHTGRAASNYAYHVSRILHMRLIVFLGAALAFALICVGFNLLDWRGLNLVISMLYLAAGLFVVSMPITIGGFVIAGGVISTVNNTPISEEMKKTVKSFMGIFWSVIFWGQFIFFVLGTVSFQEKPSLVIGVSAAAALLAVTCAALKIKVGVWKTLVFLFVAFYFWVFASALIPDAAWNKWLSFVPKSTLWPNRAESALARAEAAEQKGIEKIVEKRLSVITKKFERGEVLSEEEEKFFQSQKQKRNANTIPAKIGNWWGATPASTKYTYTLKNNESVSTYAVPDNSWVNFECNNSFKIIERSVNLDGSERIVEISMPPGRSKRYFTWGGTIQAIGKKDGDVLKILP